MRYQDKIIYKKNSYAVPSFEVLIKSKNALDNQVPFKGTGCHVNKNIALNRAIIEAIQSRVTVIVGSREDILHSKYDTTPVDWGSAHKEANEFCYFDAIPDYAVEGLLPALDGLVKKIEQCSQEIIVFKYHDEAICILKSKIIAKGLVHNVSI